MSRNNNLHTWERLIALGLASVVVVTLIAYVFFIPETNETTVGVIRFLAALVAGLAGYLFSGNLGLEGRLPFGKLGIRASGAFAAFLTVLVLFYIGIPGPEGEGPPPPIGKENSTVDVSKYVSRGERLLLKSEASKDKISGLKAFDSKAFSDAIGFFENALNQNPNDPETLIYLNNARAESDKQFGDTDSYYIAVTVPIQGEQSVAESMLRGVAQAQNEINASQNRINGKSLQIILADDAGSPEIARNLATFLSENESVLAVVGNFSSTLAKETAPLYSAGQLVSISPTATSTELSNYSSYFFRTSPSDAVAARKLAEYAKVSWGVKNVAIAYDFDNSYSESLKQEFESSFGDSAIHICDLGKDGFNPKRDCINGADEAEAFLLIPAIQTSLDKALLLINSLDGSKKLLGGDSMYSSKTSEGSSGQQSSKGELTVAIPWHRQGCSAQNKSDFETRACDLWEANINWRTATTYDAIQVIIESLKLIGSSPTSEKIRREMLKNGFSTEGATGTVEFQNGGNYKGDRQDTSSVSVLVQLQPKDNRFDFFQLAES